MGATSNLRAKRAEKNGALQNCRILCYAYFGILGNLQLKNLSQFLIVYFPQTFPGGIFLHRSMEWTPLCMQYMLLDASRCRRCEVS